MPCSRAGGSRRQAAKGKVSGTGANHRANSAIRIPVLGAQGGKSRLETLQIIITTIDNEAEFSNAV